MNKIIIATIFTLSLYANQSDLRTSEIVYDNIKTSHQQRVQSGFIDLNDEMYSGGFNDLISFITPAVDQEEAGSCLYMSHTGVLEWWLNYSNAATGQRFDLSERYYMALKTEDIGSNLVNNWRTDNIYRLNAVGKFFSNEQYPFTKNYFNYDETTGSRITSNADDLKATYNAEFNWISFKSQIDTKFHKQEIRVPKFKREIIYKDPQDDQWSVAKAPNDIVLKIKNALLTNKAPVNVIYNHHGFWHAVMIVGFNDQAPTKDCPYAQGFAPYMNKKATEQEIEAANTSDEKLAKKLLSSARLKRSKATQVALKLEQIGGCSEKGVFYVRDSITPDPLMPIYDYDSSQNGEEEHMNAPVIFREYEWIEVAGNHAYQILLEDGTKL